jgi:hypothetical protein
MRSWWLFSSSRNCFGTQRFITVIIKPRQWMLFWLRQRDDLYEGVSKSFRNGRLKREPQMVQLSATRCSCVAILLVSLATFASITLCIASQRVFIVVYFVIDSVRKLLDTPSYTHTQNSPTACNHISGSFNELLLQFRHSLLQYPSSFRPTLPCC